MTEGTDVTVPWILAYAGGIVLAVGSFGFLEASAAAFVLALLGGTFTLPVVRDFIDNLVGVSFSRPVVVLVFTVAMFGSVYLVDTAGGV